ncbi:MAG: hypothetical protein AB1Z66_11930 [Candidatus Limnocylindrales bacterium]
MEQVAVAPRPTLRAASEEGHEHALARRLLAWTGIGLGVVFGLLFLIVGPGKEGHDSHYLFAQAFLEGRLYIEGSYPWLELVPRAEGGWYTPFPPLLSVAFVPFAALDIAVDTNHVAALMGGVSVAVVWLMLGRLGVGLRVRLGLTLAWAVGSQLLWLAGEGGQHLAPQVTAAALLLAVLTLGLERRWPFLAGLLLAAAVCARLPVVFALPLVLWLYRPERQATPFLERHPWSLVLAAMIIPGLLVALYNMARFGSLIEFGYGMIEGIDGQHVLDEPWYHDGIISLAYLPNGLYTMLLRGFEVRDAFPWVYGSIAGTSILLTMPILWWVSEARGRLAVAAAVSAALVMVPNLLHGNPGFAQIGYRFILDALPMLWLMLGIAFHRSMPRAAAVALGAGIVANVWLASVYWSGLVE